MNLIIGILVTAGALWVTTAVVPGIHIEASVTAFLVVAIIFGLVQILSLPVTIVTLGLFTFVINALMLMLTAWLVGNAMSIEGDGMTQFFWALIGSVVISIASTLIGMIMPGR